jgi:hypothetical protein
MELSIADLQRKDLFIAPLTIKPFAQRERSRAFVAMRQKGLIERVPDQLYTDLVRFVKDEMLCTGLCYRRPELLEINWNIDNIELYMPTIPFTLFDMKHQVFAKPKTTIFVRYRSFGHNVWYAI